MTKSDNINKRCGNTRCPMRFSCALDIKNMPEFDIEGSCQMGWRPPKKEENNGKKKRKPKHKSKRRSRPARTRRGARVRDTG